MKRERDLEKGLYFVHGYYIGSSGEQGISELYRDHMILLKDSIDDIYDIDAYDINLREIGMQNQAPQGEFVYYDGERFQTAEDDPTSIMYTELNRQLIRLIGYENYENQPETISEDISEVYSYHVKVGHGNCSIIVFRCDGKFNIWMIDCSVFDFTDKKNNYRSNLDACMDYIRNMFGVGIISKLLVTHLHCDHINGIEYLIKKGWIDGSTEVWMNTQYPWKQPTYNRILLQLKALGVKFIDPIVANSTPNINILYPNNSFNEKNKAPKNNINNASVLYQICLDGRSMLFTGDIETEGWENVSTCMPYLCKSTYYCISHHGSITGHLRNNCIPARCIITTLADCACSTKLQVLMGRNSAYKGIFSKEVISDFSNIIKTEDAKHFIEINWSSGCHVKK
jgi:hypothetical protein